MQNNNMSFEEKLEKNEKIKKYILTVSTINVLLTIGAIVILLVKTCCG